AVFGGDGRLKFWNPAFARIWGLQPEDLLGEPHINKIVEKFRSFGRDTDDWEKMRTQLAANAMAREPQVGRLTRADDTYVEYMTTPLPDGGVLNSFLDVTATVT